VRISVDRFRASLSASNRFYREHSVDLGELNLTAYHGEEDDGLAAEPRPGRDQEVWLLFANDDARFPLYPGSVARSSTRTRSARTSGDRGSSRHPAADPGLSVRLDLPAARRPVVWAWRRRWTAEAGPLKPPVTESVRATGHTSTGPLRTLR
jgi:hypothetical protein